LTNTDEARRSGLRVVDIETGKSPKPVREVDVPLTRGYARIDARLDALPTGR
jgi:hypothetical protein